MALINTSQDDTMLRCHPGQYFVIEVLAARVA